MIFQFLELHSNNNTLRICLRSRPLSRPRLRSRLRQRLRPRLRLPFANLQAPLIQPECQVSSINSPRLKKLSYTADILITVDVIASCLQIVPLVAIFNKVPD